MPAANASTPRRHQPPRRPTRRNHHASPSRTPAMPVPSPAMPSPSSPPPPPPLERRLTFDNLAISSGRGYDLLRKSGWTPGSLLGASAPSAFAPAPVSDEHEHGHYFGGGGGEGARGGGEGLRAPLATPLPIVLRTSRAGVGASPRAVADAATTTTTTAAAAQPRSPRSPRTPRTPRRGGRPLPNWRRVAPHTPSSASRAARPTPRCAPSPQPPLIQHLADLDVYDPLRPRCRFNPLHVVRDLKLLRKHELSCPDNPHRLLSSASTASVSSPVTPAAAATFAPAASFGNRFDMPSSRAARRILHRGRHPEIDEDDEDDDNSVDESLTDDDSRESHATLSSISSQSDSEDADQRHGLA